VTFVGAAVFSLVAPKRFAAGASFVPDGGPSTTIPSGLLSLAGQFGLATGSGGAASPQFYADLITSRVIVRGLLNVRVPADTGMGRVLELLDVTERDSALRVEKAEDILRHRMTVSFDRVTRRVDVSVWMDRPATAQAVADSLLMLVDAFDRDIRRSRAGNKRAFVEEQRSRAADSLRAAESEMLGFLERNRTISSSPQLEFQRERLQRAISLRQEIFLALAREAEQSRVEEVDNRPVITVIDQPVAPARRFWPPRKKLVLLALLGVLAPVWVLLVLIELARTQIKEGGDAALATGRAVAVWRDLRRALHRSPVK
jgi:uncharacterized protein involved in exopolysaccharide biosynthesis